MKMKSIRLFSLVTAMLVGSALLCQAPPPPPVSSRVLSPYITALNAQQQGTIDGSDPLPDNSGTGIKLASLQHNVTQSYDAGSGQSTGQRRHGPLTIVKQLDSNTPKFYRALVNNENIHVVIRLYGAQEGNATTNFFTYTLNNARVVAVRNWQPNANDPAAVPYAHPEEVSFIYQSISWRDEITGTEFQDNFGSPN